MLSLYFHGTRDLAEVRDVILACARAVLGEHVPDALPRVRHEPGVDPRGYADPALGRSRWAADRIELVQTIVSGPGNPRDGWGFDMRWTLVVRGDAPQGGVRLRVHVTEADWAPRPKYLSIQLDGPAVDLDAYDRTRAALRARLGRDDDRCDHLWMAVGNAQAMLAREPPDPVGARVFLDRLHDTGEAHHEYWRQELARLRAALA